MITGIIIGDNFYQSPRTAISRANGAHRIATLLRKKNFNVDVIDFFNSWEIDELSTYINKFVKIDFIGLSIGLGQLDDTKVNQFISLIKYKNPTVKVIAGGSSVLNNNYQNVDLFYRGFADGAIDEIANYLLTKKYNITQVERVTTHDTKKVIDCNKHYKIFDLSNLRIEYTEDDHILPTETLCLETSRGCIFKCKFCNFPFTGKNKNEYIRDKDNIKTEILENYRRWGTTRYLITDDTFNDNEVKVDMMHQISKELDFKIELMCYARIDLLHAKESSLQKMIDTGFKGMFFGLETLKDETSRQIGKGFTGDKLKNYIKEIRNLYPKLHITTSMIVGLPGESYQEFSDNLKWIIDENISDSIPIYSLSIPKDNGVNYVSPFSAEWEKYEYEVMSINEIKEIVNRTPALGNFNIEKYTAHNIPWKNKHMNFLEAGAYLNKSLGVVKGTTSASGWFGFAYSFHSDDLIKILHTKKHEFDWEAQKDKASQFVSDYKIKKIK